MRQDHQLITAQGRLFLRHWKPAQAGGGAALVLFHDSLGCVELWRDFPERLAEATGRDVVAYDRLGFGRSDPHPGRLGLDFVRAEALGAFPALRNDLGLEHFIAVGHSVGGAMAAVCAATFPAHCRALVTESAQAFVEERTLAGIRHAREVFARAGQLDRLKKYHGDKAAWVLGAWVDTWLDEGFRHWTLDPDLARVRCPVLAIHGERDEFGSILQPERIASGCAGPAAVEILPGCGHVPHRAQEKVVVDLIRTFLEGVGRYPGPGGAA